MTTESTLTQLKALWIGRWLTDFANTSAFIFNEFKDINWVGFYLSDKTKLYLGPFQGLPACTEIEFGRGVCGKSFVTQKTLRVANVHDFPDHITCDAASRSELVIPLEWRDQFIGVLDIDSPITNRFSEADQTFFETMANSLMQRQETFSQ